MRGRYHHITGTNQSLAYIRWRVACGDLSSSCVQEVPHDGGYIPPTFRAGTGAHNPSARFRTPFFYATEKSQLWSKRLLGKRKGGRLDCTPETGSGSLSMMKMCYTRRKHVFYLTMKYKNHDIPLCLGYSPSRWWIIRTSLPLA